MRLRTREERVVLLRVTAHEHQALREGGAARGEGSLSELVRVEVWNPASRRIESLSGTRTVSGSGVGEARPA